MYSSWLGLGLEYNVVRLSQDSISSVRLIKITYFIKSADSWRSIQLPYVKTHCDYIRTSSNFDMIYQDLNWPIQTLMRLIQIISRRLYTSEDPLSSRFIKTTLRLFQVLMMLIGTLFNLFRLWWYSFELYQDAWKLQKFQSSNSKLTEAALRFKHGKDSFRLWLRLWWN